jgi:hypothetical protein
LEKQEIKHLEAMHSIQAERKRVQSELEFETSQAKTLDTEEEQYEGMTIPQCTLDNHAVDW